MLAVKTFSKKQIPILNHLHNHLFVGADLKTPLRKLLLSYIYKDSVCVGVSNGVTKSAAPFAKQTYTLINGVHFSRLKEINQQKLISPNILNIIMMGNHFERKGVDIASRAVARLSEMNIEAKLYVVTSQPHVVKQFIEKSLGEELLSEKSAIECIPTRNDIASYLNSCNVFVSPSREEGLAIAPLEAAWCGCYVILSEISGQNELQIPSAYWIADPNTDAKKTEDDLFNSLLAIAQSHQVKSDCRQHLEDLYGLQRWTNGVLQLYKRLL